MKKVKVLLGIILLLCIVLIIIIMPEEKNRKTNAKVYISGSTPLITLYDEEYNEVGTVSRGTNVTSYKVKEKKGDIIYIKVKYNDKFYFVNQDSLTRSEKEIIKEKEMYVRTNVTLYKEKDSSKVESYIKKGSKLDILGFDKVNSDGIVNKYKVKYNDLEGYVYGKYLVTTKEEAIKKYDENGIQEYMKKMGSSLGGGIATELDYYPYEKPKFKNNVMPDEVRALYLNAVAIRNVDDYIEFAKDNNINAFVIDIKDNTTPAYNSPIMKKYSPTNYEHALNDYEVYKANVKKAKDAGLYLIGRITTFKDSYFVDDHKEVAITNNAGEPFSHNGSYWPTAFNRYVWEFNVELAKEAVNNIGFNEIQFDYVRFPDRTTRLEKDGVIDLHNTYDEEKAEALQNFVMYACDQIHELGAYVSIDVFGESASDYVTAYGQFWPAISNVADVISGMPYPDHFNPHEYGIKEVVWTVPYKILNAWGAQAKGKQDVIPTPAVVRTWIQTYNTSKKPSVVYDASKVSDEIQALYDNGLTGGYMTWNSGSNLVKYNEVKSAFKKVYK